ncbi:DNA polymerase III subunit delta' [Waterburya agarophytonicola K14]|uniref:DNA polymerase III subunit delta n=1 Tax=Waterburya agarophytonicola KI4 TaxID=2874699 RepID=A0A964BSH6_9CYAN|nr:DNA polymerase III subunit delta' [Waterburya agarophytonicola]MCC0178665.1 DNA polymerase III subunit delta' [Waterburya agarophytonicola KI4]
MFKDLLGQDKAIELLQQAIKQERIAPAYLFSGSLGIGKSIAAKGFTQLLLTADLPPEKHPLIQRKLASGNHPDLLWVEPTYLSKGELYTASQAESQGLQYKTPPKIRIEQIRNITQFLHRPILEASRKVVVIESAQTMAESPANALLKTLEEPGNATLILIAPDADSLLVTLVSRCQRIQFYSLSQADLTTVLSSNGHGEILEHPELMAIAQGSPGKAIAAWHQLQTIPDELLQQLKRSITTPLKAMELAQTITQELDGQTQLWLVDYLQYYSWQKNHKIELMEQWEKTRKCLLSYVQPRLVWECALLSLI